jgi:hypothetical protein
LAVAWVAQFPVGTHCACLQSPQTVWRPALPPLLHTTTPGTHLTVAATPEMIAKLFDLEDYAGTYRETRNAYLKAANQLKLATGPYKAARDAYVAATATYTKSLYE